MERVELLRQWTRRLTEYELLLVWSAFVMASLSPNASCEARVLWLTVAHDLDDVLTGRSSEWARVLDAAGVAA